MKELQEQRDDDLKLTVHDIITLIKIKKGSEKSHHDQKIIFKLLEEGLIEKVGRGKAQKYILSKEYYKFTERAGSYTVDKPLNELRAMMLIKMHFEEFEDAKMSDFYVVLGKFMTDEQIKYMIYKLSQPGGMLMQIGTGRGTRYIISETASKSNQLVSKAFSIGFEELKRRGEWSGSQNEEDTKDEE